MLDNDIASMDNPRDETKECKQDVDNQILATSFLSKNTQWRKKYSQNELENVSTC